MLYPLITDFQIQNPGSIRPDLWYSDRRDLRTVLNLVR
jgi:hypothetical protein